MVRFLALLAALVLGAAPLAWAQDLTVTMFRLLDGAPIGVVQIREVPKPVPADDEVLVKAFATTVNSGDARVRALRVPRGLGLAMRLKLGFTKPKQPILGFVTAGQVFSLTAFKPLSASSGEGLPQGEAKF